MLKQYLSLGTLLLVVVIQSVRARAFTYSNDNNHVQVAAASLGEDKKRGAEFQQAMHKFLHDNEHKRLRHMLKLAMLENQHDFNDDESEESGNMFSSEMPFYFDHIKSLVSGDDAKLRRRSHRKRSNFDSIGHQGGGLGGLGGSHRPRKLEFTFENLLPYLLQEMRRKRREFSDVHY